MHTTSLPRPATASVISLAECRRRRDARAGVPDHDDTSDDLAIAKRLCAQARSCLAPRFRVPLPDGEDITAGTENASNVIDLAERRRRRNRDDASDPLTRCEALANEAWSYLRAAGYGPKEGAS